MQVCVCCQAPKILDPRHIPHLYLGLPKNLLSWSSPKWSGARGVRRQGVQIWYLVRWFWSSAEEPAFKHVSSEQPVPWCVVNGCLSCLSVMNLDFCTAVGGRTLERPWAVAACQRSVCAAVCVGQHLGFLELYFVRMSWKWKKDIANGRSKKGGSSKVDKIEETILKFSEHAGSGESLVSVEHLLIVSQQPCSVVKRKNQS